MTSGIGVDRRARSNRRWTFAKTCGHWSAAELIPKCEFMRRAARRAKSINVAHHFPRSSPASAFFKSPEARQGPVPMRVSKAAPRTPHV
jgi:hypothetical protein